MAAHEESPSTSRLSWLVGTPRRLGGYVLDAVSSGESPNTSTAGEQISIREWWRVASTTKVAGPYASAAQSAREDGMMTCPYAKGQTELPPGHPMIPGMALTSKPANTSAQKFLAVGKSTASTSSSASTAAVAAGTDDAAMAMVVQAAARNMLARQQQQRALDAQKRTASAVPSTGGTIAGASNLASLGRASMLGCGQRASGCSERLRRRLEKEQRRSSRPCAWSCTIYKFYLGERESEPALQL